MSQEPFPQSNEPHPDDHSSAERAFTIDPARLHTAMRYVEEVAPTWILEPSEVTVDQPANQAEKIRTLESELGSHPDGQKLQQHVQSNLASIRSKQANAVHGGFARLNIRAGFNLNDLRFAGDNLTKEEYEMLRDESWPNREAVVSSEQSNPMIEGLLDATGAVLLLHEAGEGGAIKKVYKGMFEGKPVYFDESISPRTRGEHDPNQKTRTYLERTFTVVSEQAVRHSLNKLTPKDADVLRSIDVKIPKLLSPEYHPDTYPNRSRMIETVHLYAALNLDPEAESGDETGEAHP